ncbi:hypothetical protein I4F81_003212 [Pyropia yezoensis]|uniref:Uncharacterized protein n=1 Tax=Pyropia yezoensis TaxID=2788 RepID=A0ACC3BRN9_PYRYE|nr:hypothetical protein I4F81_003212 [Neopyropia yezoensis]
MARQVGASEIDLAGSASPPRWSLTDRWPQGLRRRRRKWRCRCREQQLRWPSSSHDARGGPSRVPHPAQRTDAKNTSGRLAPSGGPTHAIGRDRRQRHPDSTERQSAQPRLPPRAVSHAPTAAAACAAKCSTSSRSPVRRHGGPRRCRRACRRHTPLGCVGSRRCRSMRPPSTWSPTPPRTG